MNGEKVNRPGTIVNRQDAKNAKKVFVNTNCRNNHQEPRMTRMGTAVYQRNPRNPWLKEVKKSPWRLGGSKLFPRLRVRSAASRGTGPAANPRFGDSPIIPWRPWRLGGSKRHPGGSVVKNISAPSPLHIVEKEPRIPQMTRMGTAVYQRNPCNPWFKEVKKSPWRLGGSNPRFGGSKSSSRLRGKSSPGFTLMEMLVVLAIMVVMMAAVGEIFSLAGHSVRLGQATLKVMANVRAVEAQLARDVSHIDTNGYLIIRQSVYAPLWLANVQYEPGDEVSFSGQYYYCIKENIADPTNNPGIAPSYYWTVYSGGTSPVATATQLPVWRDDQITFIAHGSFQSRTGNNGTGASASPLVDYVTSNSAAVWYGQLTASYGPSATTGSLTVGLPEEKPWWRQSTPVPQGQPPSGETAGDFYLGRHVLLLAPSTSPNSVTVNGSYTDAAYSDIVFGTPLVTPYSGETSADITSSRLDLAAITPAAIEAEIVAMAPPPSPTIPDDYCYRFASLVTPAASSQTDKLINGYFRMTPIILPGVPSFSVDVGYMVGGNMRWYGPDQTTLIPPGVTPVPRDQGDIQSLVFDAANRPYWPTALRITYTVTDPHNRMEGGQTITQIIQLPQ